MNQLTRRMSLASDLLRQGDLAKIGEIVGHRVWSSYDSYKLRRDMAEPFAAPEPLIPIHVRPASKRDLHLLLDPEEPTLSRAERWERRNRLHLYSAGFTHCFVATTDDDRPCYIQWLILPGENDLLRRTYRGVFPALAPEEILLEAAYTPEAFRGQRIMPAAMAILAERAGNLGARWAITYVGVDNAASLKGCARAGFYPCLNKHVRCRLGWYRTVLDELPGASTG